MEQYGGCERDGGPQSCLLRVTWCICLITAQFTGVTIRDYRNGYARDIYYIRIMLYGIAQTLYADIFGIIILLL